MPFFGPFRSFFSGLLAFFQAPFVESFVWIHDGLSRRQVDEKEFLKQVLQETPEQMFVDAFFGDSILLLSFVSAGTSYSTIVRNSLARPMPTVYGILFKAANDRGEIVSPITILTEHRAVLFDYLGIDAVEASLDRRGAPPGQ